MRDEIRQLIKLQKLDQTLTKLKASKADLTGKVAQADKIVQEVKQRAENHSSEAQSFRVGLDAREVDLKAIEGQIGKLSGQLNIVKTNKEYSALQHEIMGAKANMSKLEDEILQMMDQIEKDKAATAALAKEAEEAEKTSRQQKEAIATAVEDAEARIERLSAEREELKKSIPEKYLSPYERLHRKGDGNAMAQCHSFVCGACRMSLTANTVNLLMPGDKLIYCHSCGRILYLPDDEDIHGGIGAGRKA